MSILIAISGCRSIKSASCHFFLPKHHMPIFTSLIGIVLADYGATWKEHRRFALMTFRNFGLGKQSMEQRILGEIQYTMETLEKSIGKP